MLEWAALVEESLVAVFDMLGAVLKRIVVRIAWVILIKDVDDLDLVTFSSTILIIFILVVCVCVFMFMP